MTEAALASYVPLLPALRVALAKLRAKKLHEIAAIIEQRIQQTEEYIREISGP